KRLTGAATWHSAHNQGCMQHFNRTRLEFIASNAV
ncbi:hypothetical protein PSYJA_36499, partial [Pseudomonas syringae pv. japonica str. M301072]